MGSKWRKVKLALGMNTCLYVPQTLDDSSSSIPRLSDAVSPSTGHSSDRPPTTPTPSSSGLRLSLTGSKSSKVCIFRYNPIQQHFCFLFIFYLWRISLKGLLFICLYHLGCFRFVYEVVYWRGLGLFSFKKNIHGRFWLNLWIILVVTIFKLIIKLFFILCE